MDKFLWLAALFLSALAAIGLDALIRGGTAPRRVAVAAAVLAVVLCLLALLPGQLDWWSQMVRKIPASGAFTMYFSDFGNPGFIALSSRNAIHCLLHGALVLFVAAAILELAGSRRGLACLAALFLAVIELASFAWTSMASFQIQGPDSPVTTKFLAQHPGDYRIWQYNPNVSMTIGAFNVEGDDPSGLLRYRRFLDFAEGFDFDAEPYRQLPSSFDSTALAMLRCRYLLPPDAKLRAENTMEIPAFLPHLLLVDRFRVMTNFHGIFSTLTNADFKMTEEVILESQPDPLPQPAPAKGTATLLKSSTDFLEIQADVPAPALLLITDSYSRGWRALALPGSTQARYEVMPANYCLRAIPLAAGHHLLRLEYSPLGFRVGKVISIAALAVFIVLTAWRWKVSLIMIKT